MSVKIENYNKIIKSTTILENINIEFTEGKIYGLKGKNGSGKTMLMRAICGLIKPTTGKVIINNEILGKDITFPRSIGLLIENPSFLSNYTGFKNLKQIASIKKLVSDEEIRETLTKVGLDPFDKRTYRKYSLGMKQKLGIAAAIMENPDIIILDEPINALDEQSVITVKNLLMELKNESRIIIIACHDSEELNLLSDVIIEISDGRIIKQYNNSTIEGQYI